MCDEHRRLNDAVWLVVRELVELLDREAAARITGGPVVERFLLARALAMERHHDAKRALLLHTCNHCCSNEGHLEEHQENGRPILRQVPKVF